MLNDDIELLYKNLELILRNRDKIMNDSSLSNVKIQGTGVYIKKAHKFITFTLGELLRLWTAIPSTWWFKQYITYRLDLFGDGWGNAYSMSIVGKGLRQDLYDEDIIGPLIEHMIRIGKVVVRPKRLKNVINRLKRERNEI